ncbi:uncharacterized protein LOC108674913 [Hyalella azteca]|uniref:Uncharacterized protein LOC108674913 n=1 Tax=Hyalella azteca TaxID=294128 RepID=A0A8B7NXE2_HYAAZ|nr:uncharacterized protein LOC108674913 [Hyalella azteca]
MASSFHGISFFFVFVTFLATSTTAFNNLPAEDENLSSGTNITKTATIFQNKMKTMGNGSETNVSQVPEKLTARARDGRSVWTSAEDTTEAVTTKTSDADELPEELPTPAALAIPVPSFLANLFSGVTNRESRPSRVRHRENYRSNLQPDQISRYDGQRIQQVVPYPTRTLPRKVYRQRQVSGSLPDDYQDYDPVFQRQIPTRRASFGHNRAYHRGQMQDYDSNNGRNEVAINDKYDFVTDASNLPKVELPSKNRILDSATFSVPLSSQVEDQNAYSLMDKARGTGFGSAVNYGDSRFDILDHKSHIHSRKDISFDYDDSQNTYEEYDYDSLPKQNFYQSFETPKFNVQEDGSGVLSGLFSSVQSLNPLNYFGSSKVAVGPPATRSGRRRGHQLHGPQRAPQLSVRPLSHEAVTENAAFTEYIDFSELEPFYSTENRRSDERRNRVRAELPPGVRHLEPLSKKIQTRRKPHYTFRNKQIPNEAEGRRVYAISNEEVIFNDAPHYRGVTPEQKEHLANDFIVNIPSNEVQFEDDPVEEDPRLEASKFKEDFPLREDLYVGKDGNIYLKNPSTKSKKATATDSDDFLGLHMYGMDQPLYQEVPKPQTRFVSYTSNEARKGKQGFDKRRPHPAAQSPVQPSTTSNNGRMDSADLSSDDEIPKLGGRSPHVDAAEAPSAASPNFGRPLEATRRKPSPRFPASGQKTPYVSDFAKTLLKVQKTKARSSEVQQERSRTFRRMKD